LGQLDRRKRIDLLIKKFKESKLDADLYIGGIGVDRPLLESLVEGDSRIKFLGFIKDEDLCNFYNSLDLLVMPTWMEGWGIPIVEAMACKVPTMILADAIIPSEVRNRCIIVEDLRLPFGNEAYLRGLLTSVDIDENYKWAKTHSWDKCVEEYIKVYEELVG
jgi:glycosyltransferase involved in cell wall biosynthesis